MILFAEDAIKAEERLYMFASNINLLFSVDLWNGDISLLGGIPGENPFCERLTCELIYWEKQIIVVPLLAGKIWIYSLKSESWRSIPIETFGKDGQASCFRHGIIYRNALFLIGGHYPAVMKMDLFSCKMSYIKEPFFRFESEKTNELFFRGAPARNGDVLYLASARDNSVFVFHLDTQEYQWIEVGGEGNRYSGIMWDGNYYWISPRKNTPVVKWDGKDEITEYEIPEGKRVNNISYAGITGKGKRIMLPALRGSRADSIFVSDNGRMEFEDRRYTFYKKIEDGSYLAQDANGNIIVISKEGEERQFQCTVPEEDFYSLWDMEDVDAAIFIGKINKENGLCPLSGLLQLVKRTNIILMQDGQYMGSKIWETEKR